MYGKKAYSNHILKSPTQQNDSKENIDPRYIWL